MINAIDICGTGGSPHHTLSISTAAAFVVAACGVPVAKHAGRARTSPAGSIDVVEALGAEVDLDLEQCLQLLSKTGICFLNAGFLGTKKFSGAETALNNPLNPRLRLIGYRNSRDYLDLIDARANISAECFFVTSGCRFDELCDACCNPGVRTNLASSKRKHLDADELRGGDAAYNAAALREVFTRKKMTPYKHQIIFNAGVAIALFNRTTIDEGEILAIEAVQKRKALKKLDEYIQATKEV